MVMRISSLLHQFRPCRILVVGDVLLDRYVCGEAERVSPEAPVLVLKVDREEVRLGGAGGVALFAKALGADVSLAGAIGHDSAAMTVQALCNDEGIDCSLLLKDPTRCTPVKERLLGRIPGKSHLASSEVGGQHLLRVDREQRCNLSSDLESLLTDAICSQINLFDAILISDYAKGTCTPTLLRRLIAAGRSIESRCPVLVDPGRGKELSLYSGATLLKPNRSEAATHGQHELRCKKAALSVATNIRRAAGVDNVVITLDCDGYVHVAEDQPPTAVTALARTPIDIAGAGDMFLAAAGVAMASGLSVTDACETANFAAGLEIEKPGLSPIPLDEMRLKSQERTTVIPKRLSLDQAREAAAAYRRAGRTVVYTNGCFDMLHYGHVAMLNEAAEQGDILIVAANSDASVQVLKGLGRPVVPESGRLQMLEALSCVDHVLQLDEHTPHRQLQEIRPDVLVKGGTTSRVVGQEIVLGYGGRIHLTSTTPGVSTTGLLSRMTQSQPAGALQESPH